MADSELPALPNVAAPAGTDILYIVTDPGGGSEADGKVTAATLVALAKGRTATIVYTSAVSGGHSPLDATTYYFANFPGFAPATATSAITAYAIMPRAGNVRRVYLHFLVFGTLGSTETFTVAVRNASAATTENVTTGMQMNAGQNVQSNTAMTLAFSAGDVLAIQFTTPSWVTNPTAAVYNATLDVEYSS